MIPEPAPPTPPQPSKRAPAAEPDAAERLRTGQPQPVEHYGPVEIARHVKDDGRALLLYTHIAPREPA
jgi:hypothetical protein